MSDPLRLDLTAVVLAVADGAVQVATTASDFRLPPGAAGPEPVLLHTDWLPTEAFDPARVRTLQEGVRALAGRRLGLTLGYVEQLYTFADRGRDPAELFGGPRAVAIGYLALVRAPNRVPPDGVVWRDLYECFPWEDARDGRPPVVARVILPGLTRWIERAGDTAQAERRRERVHLAFAPDNDSWDAVRVLERYELLYEAGLVVESARDRALEDRAEGASSPARGPMPAALGRPLAHDARRLLATALERLRGKLRYRPVVFELLPPVFTLNQVQTVVEALTGSRLHKQNFRRLLLSGGLVEPTGRFETQTGGRPAELFRFARQAIHERSSAAAHPTPGG